MLVALAGVGGANLRIRLYKNNPTISDDTQLSDLTEADYDGYAPFSSAGWGGPTLDTNADEYLLSPVAVFQKAAGSIPNTVYGYFVTIEGAGGSKLMGVEKFDTPQSMTASTDQIPLRVKVALRQVS